MPHIPSHSIIVFTYRNIRLICTVYTADLLTAVLNLCLSRKVWLDFLKKTKAGRLDSLAFQHPGHSFTQHFHACTFFSVTYLPSYVRLLTRIKTDRYSTSLSARIADQVRVHNLSEIYCGWPPNLSRITRLTWYLYYTIWTPKMRTESRKIALTGCVDRMTKGLYWRDLMPVRSVCSPVAAMYRSTHRVYRVECPRSQIPRQVLERDVR